MTKKTKIYIMLVLFISLMSLGFTNKDTNLTKYLNEQNSQMSTMMKAMKNIKHTGDTAIDFLYGMIPHHEAAVEMSQSLIKYGGENDKIKKIAQNIISSQSKEIAEMEVMIKEMELSPQVDKSKESEYLKEYNNMLSNMNSHNLDSGNSVDEAFTIGMIKHHKMAIDMAESILKYTNNQKIIDMANNIIKAQGEEIKQMKEILSMMEK